MLQRAGIDMHSLSIVGKNIRTDEHVVGYYNYGRPDEVPGQDPRILGRLPGMGWKARRWWELQQDSAPSGGSR
jgi:hypothetical protein